MFVASHQCDGHTPWRWATEHHWLAVLLRRGVSRVRVPHQRPGCAIPLLQEGRATAAPFMTVNNEQQLLLIFSVPCTARSCSSVVQRALIFWFDYKIKKKFPSEDVKADIFPTCFSKTFHQITDMRLTCWLMGFIFRRAKRAPSYLLSTHKDNARKMHPFGDWTTLVLHSFSSTMFLFTDISYITDPVLAQFLTFKRLFSRASVTLIFLGFTLNKSYAFFHNDCTNQTKNGGETQVWKYFFKFPKQKMIHW